MINNVHNSKIPGTVPSRVLFYLLRRSNGAANSKQTPRVVSKNASVWCAPAGLRIYLGAVPGTALTTFPALVTLKIPSRFFPRNLSTLLLSFVHNSAKYAQVNKSSTIPFYRNVSYPVNQCDLRRFCAFGRNRHDVSCSWFLFAPTRFY